MDLKFIRIGAALRAMRKPLRVWRALNVTSRNAIVAYRAPQPPRADAMIRRPRGANACASPSNDMTRIDRALLLSVHGKEEKEEDDAPARTEAALPEDFREGREA